MSRDELEEAREVMLSEGLVFFGHCWCVWFFFCGLSHAGSK